ncbi:MAG TPA: SgcJ/EcaC family oxidoreductase [Candidatus Baltobacteraceae bacterium]|nr:SgcJ/EcaC family oxidoreductase [Candidatus Baltobacteraceae bacterium]
MSWISSVDDDALQAIVAELAQAWNAGDAQRFAARFAWDGEQVNIFGAQLHGRREVAQRHDRIFKTIFRGSTNVFEILDARVISADVIVARVSSVVTVPEGPLQGELRTIASMILQRTAAQWEIVLFHNTRNAPDAAPSLSFTTGD